MPTKRLGNGRALGAGRSWVVETIFVAGILAGGITYGAVSVFGFGVVPENLRHMPVIAFQEQIWLTLFLAVVGAVLASVAWRQRRRLAPPAEPSLWGAAGLGLIYPAVTRWPLAGAVLWALILGYPILCGAFGFGAFRSLVSHRTHRANGDRG